MLQNLALWCHRRRGTVLALWVVAAIAFTALAGVAHGRDADGSLPGTDSQAAYDLFKQEFPQGSDEASAVVFHASGGLARHRQAIEAYLATVNEAGGTSTLRSPFAGEGGAVAPDGTTAFTSFGFVGDPSSSQVEARAGAMDRAAADLRADGVEVAFLGWAFQGGDMPASELFGILAAVVILLIAFGSVVAMGLPIITALLGIVISLAGVALWANVIDTPDFAAQMAAMIGLGVGIDYALFIVTRYREAVRRGAGPEAAIAEAIGTAGRAVTFAGMTVMISLLGMFLMGLPFLYGLAVGTATAVAVAVLAAVTLLPALLGYLGRHLDRLSVHRRLPDGRETGWHRWSRLVQRHPVAFAGGGLLVLLLAAAPVTVMRLGTADAGNDPVGSTTRVAYDLLADGFGPGANGPLVLAVRTPDAAARAEVRTLPATLRELDGVAMVEDVVPSASGDAALITVYPTTAPQDPATADLVHRLRRDVVPATGLEVHVGGQTAGDVDFSTAMADRLPVFIGAVLTLSFLLLMAVFRSVLVPLKAVVMNLLSIGAAYGIVVAVFQWGWLGGLFGSSAGGPIEPWAPMMLFAVVFGLSMDYEVFLLSAVKERYDLTGDNSYAVVEGLAATARVITAAAAIMVCVFGSFLVGDLRALRLMGLGLATAVLVDATVVRMVLVPATMELLGRANWWMPGWLDRLLPQVEVDRHAPPGGEPTVIDLVTPATAEVGS